MIYTLKDYTDFIDKKALTDNTDYADKRALIDNIVFIAKMDIAII